MDAYVEKKQVDEDYLLSIRKNETTNILEKNQPNNFSNDTTQSISLVHPKSVNNKNSDDKKIGKGNKDNNNFIINDLEKQTNQISINILNILKASNIPDRDILKRTSNRFAKAFLYLTEGYNMNDYVILNTTQINI